ncbi:hypothetical protein [Ruicaihuangia caeni]|uniref:hypothetical protein n=1 Tax=Ruicaihuangia caeni TaxID=3042517 RepID=UPI00338D528B
MTNFPQWFILDLMGEKEGIHDGEGLRRVARTWLFRARHSLKSEPLDTATRFRLDRQLKDAFTALGDCSDDADQLDAILRAVLAVSANVPHRYISLSDDQGNWSEPITYEVLDPAWRAIESWRDHLRMVHHSGPWGL